LLRPQPQVLRNAEERLKRRKKKNKKRRRLFIETV
jgi:hypothetical protein